MLWRRDMAAASGVTQVAGDAFAAMEDFHGPVGDARVRECQTFCVSVIWSMLPERSEDYDDIERTAGRVAEGLQAA